MTTRELFKRRVIELIHGLPYKEAIKKEVYYTYQYRNDPEDLKLWHDISTSEIEEIKHIKPITIGRVMKAILNYYKYEAGIAYSLIDGYLYWVDNYENICKWKLTNEDGRECTDDDQTDETIEKLYNLKKN